MPKSTLLLREKISSNSLTSIVAKSQNLRPPFPEYNLAINSSQLDITLLYKPLQYIKPLQADEGFESDIDSISLVSSDESFTSSTCLVEDHVLKHRENDSANGSSSSESDNEATTIEKKKNLESYGLSDILCYTDVNFPKVLVFVIKEEVLVFSFEHLDVLNSFYASFSTLKAVTNQRTYGRVNTKFNLLHRTDVNGVTHIEISREPYQKIVLPEPTEPSSIISINTPDIKPEPFRKTLNNKEKSIKSIFLDDSKVVLSNEVRTSRSEFYPQNAINSFTLKPKSNLDAKKPSPDNPKEDKSLKKVWKSAEDLLDVPKRPERKRKPKGRAPLPPVEPKQNVLKGQFVRVAVDPKKSNELKTTTNEAKICFQTFSSNVQTFTPNWNNIRTPQSPLILTTINPKPNKVEHKRADQNWTNSVPRLLRKPRSKSETRTPMAYRYIDTTNKPQNQYTTSSQTISNRLFGLSQKLKEFGSNVVNPNNRNFTFYDGTTETRRNSLGEMSYKVGSNESNLKSVIKKQDDKKGRSGNEKKVTFSAYATVQVV